MCSSAPSDYANNIRIRFTPVLNPKTQRGRDEDTPFGNCAKKQRVGKTNANLYAPFCTFVTSVTTPLEKGGVTDEDGEP